MSEKKTRNRRTKEEVIASIDNKIAYHKDCIAKLEEQKQAKLNPAPRQKKTTMKDISALINAKGISTEALRKMIEEIESNQES